MNFQPGNSLWMLRENVSNEHSILFKDGNELLVAVRGYFDWVVENPLYQEVIGWYEGGVNTHLTPKMRAMTIKGLCLHIGCGYQAWCDWRKEREDLQPVIEWAEAIIYEQKFTGAAAGLLNATIVARDLGLAEKQEVSGGVKVVIQGKDADL